MASRDIYDKFTEHIDQEAKLWPTYPMEISPGYPPIDVPMIPATIAESIAEKYFVPRTPERRD